MAPRVCRLARSLLAVGFLWLGVLPSLASALEVRLLPPSPRQGDVVMLVVAGAPGAREVEGTLAGRALAFFPHGDEHAALAGVDMEVKPGKAAWSVDVVDGAGRAHRATGGLVVRERSFPVERLSLPQGMVDLDPATERRAEAEATRLRTLYASVTPERLWRGRFIRPVGGDDAGQGFGARRVINGQPRMPHSGLDYKGARGTAVMASNRGRVTLVADFFFAGRLVILDHGLGLYTAYFHLDRADVREGEMVERGQVLGAVGSTGRATGPHLHWAALLQRARVDPSELFSLSLAE